MFVNLCSELKHVIVSPCNPYMFTTQCMDFVQNSVAIFINSLKLHPVTDEIT